MARVDRAATARETGGDRVRTRLLLALSLAGVVAGSTSFSGASFTADTRNAANGFTTAPDWVAPTVARAAVVRDGATVAGRLKPGGSYYVYAEIADSGNPASGIASASADLSALTAGAGTTALTAGSWTAAGQSYGHRAGPLNADALLGAGAVAFSISATDSAANERTVGGFAVQVDPTAPAATDVQATDGGGTSARLQPGDSLTLTFSEPIDPGSVVAGWDGSAATSIVVRLNRATAGSGDNLTFYAPGNVTQLPLGTVDLGRNDFTNTGITFSSSQLTHSRVTVAGTMVSRLRVVLGTQSAAPRTARGTGTMSWRPGAGIQDPAGNGATPTAVAESGAVDADF